jgi:hypothetical protein
MALRLATTAWGRVELSGAATGMAVGVKLFWSLGRRERIV